MKNALNPQISGKNGGHSVNLHEFFKQGVCLLGHIEGADQQNHLKISDDLYERLHKNDEFEENILKLIDEYIQKNSLDIPIEEIIPLNYGFNQKIITDLDLEKENINTIIWTTGFSRDYSFIKISEPIVDKMGYPIQKRGISPIDGLYFIGMPWIYTNSSGFVLGVGRDAEYLVNEIIIKNNPKKQ
jgi:putative flavoprotein involved in K+ transport